MSTESLNIKQPMDGALETARLVGEPLTAAHAVLLFPELRNPALYRFIPQDPPPSIDTLTSRFERLASQPHSPDGDELWLNWVLRERASDAYAGMLEATVIPGQSATIAYFVFVPYQRQGYAHEGVGALVKHLFTVHQVDVVVAEIDTRNRASIALVKTLGFTCAARTDNADYFNGAPSDEYRFELPRQARA